MGNSQNVMDSNPDFRIVVKTGDIKGAGTDANVAFWMFDETGLASPVVQLGSVYESFRASGTDTFPMHNCPGDFGGKISKIKLVRGGTGVNNGWYVDRIIVINRTHNCFTFPVHRWIKCGHVYSINHLDTSLPQFDFENKEQRKMELDDKRNLYDLTVRAEGLTAQV